VGANAGDPEAVPGGGIIGYAECSAAQDRACFRRI